MTSYDHKHHKIPCFSSLHRENTLHRDNINRIRTRPELLKLLVDNQLGSRLSPARSTQLLTSFTQ